MRIGMMADAYKPHISGITNYIELNKRYLEQAGHDVFVFTFGNEEYQDDEPHIIRSPGLPLVDTGYYLSFQHSRQAKKLCKRWMSFTFTSLSEWTSGPALLPTAQYPGHFYQPYPL